MLLVGISAVACAYEGQPQSYADGGVQSGISIEALPPGMALTAAPSCEGVDPAVMPPDLDQTPIGWASVDDYGQAGTTGGLGGELVLATTLADLTTQAERPEPLILAFCGVVGTGAERLALASNKTLVGVGTRPTLRVSVELDASVNVVIRNLFIEQANPDGISLRRSHHVWVDHVDISDATDGNLDVTNQSNYVTVSWSTFWYQNLASTHRFSNLVGSGDEHTEDTDLLKVSYHHNWWANNVTERMPRVRYGDIHVFNNLYTSRDNNYCIRAGVESHVLVENNYFWWVKGPTVLEGGNLLERGNVLDRAVGLPVTTGVAFDPPYAYAMDSAADIPTLIPANAGPR